MKEKNAKVNPVLAEEMHLVLEKIEKVASKLRDDPTFVREVNESKQGIPLRIKLEYFPFYNNRELVIWILNGRQDKTDLEIEDSIHGLRVPLSVGNLSILRKQFVKLVKANLGTNYESNEFFRESELYDEKTQDLEYFGVSISSILEVKRVKD